MEGQQYVIYRFFISKLYLHLHSRDVEFIMISKYEAENIYTIYFDV